MKTKIWFLLDNRMGSVGQAKGIIQELSPELFEIKTLKLEYNRWAALPNFIRRNTLIGLVKNEAYAEILTQRPDIVVSTSRRTAPVALFIKKNHKDVKILQLMHPGNYGISRFEKVFLPLHDKNKKARSNFYFTAGSPHKVSLSALEEARGIWQKQFADLPRPLTAVIVGGSIKKRPFALENALSLAQKVKQLKQDIGGSILITTSRRTGEEAEKLIMKTLEGIPAHTFLWGSKENNPLMGYYACADNLVLTGDSVSMCCEACGTGKPVFIFTGKKWLTPKHNRFVQSLYNGGYAVPLEHGCESFQGGKILYPAAEIAAEITKLAD